MKTPREYQEIIETVTGEYSNLSGQLETILAEKPAKWLSIRAQSHIKSDTAADREWDATPTGQQEMRLRMTLKRLERELSAAKSGLRLLEAESRNQF